MMIPRLIYSNKNDPRTFVFAHPVQKWRGAMLNFAHQRSWWIFFGMILLFAVPVIAVFCSETDVCSEDVCCTGYLICGMTFLWAVLILAISVGWAVRDLKKSPGKQSFRF